MIYLCESLKIKPMTAETQIPDIVDPLGKHWNQPHKRFIEMDETHALMSEQTLKGLANYSCSNPTGCYEGKMWRREQNNGEWLLCWFENIPNNDTHCYTKSRILIII
jgi:hypothetical protein